MAGLKGSLKLLSNLQADIKRLPQSVAHDIAQASAPEITSEARRSFDAGRTAYDAPRPLGVDGNELTLERTGALRRAIKFAAVGSTVRAVLRSVPYARYFIGYSKPGRASFEVLPPANKFMPSKWHKKITNVVNTISASSWIRGAR